VARDWEGLASGRGEGLGGPGVRTWRGIGRASGRGEGLGGPVVWT